MIYMHRNGVTEQIKFYRTQPEHMKYAQFDFEVDEERNKAALSEVAVLVSCILILAALFFGVYL